MENCNSAIADAEALPSDWQAISNIKVIALIIQMQYLQVTTD